MGKRERIIHTRGSVAETPNWRFGISTTVPRPDVPEFCEALAYLALERNGSANYYPDYAKRRTGAAFEWYLPYRRQRFGFKVAVEFWVSDTDVEKLGGYVLYGEDHPQRGRVPEFSRDERSWFQKHITQTLQIASEWDSRPLDYFHPVHYVCIPHHHLFTRLTEVPQLGIHILPSVLLGRQRRPVSAVVHSIPARHAKEADNIAARNFARLCAVLTLATGHYHESFKSQVKHLGLKKSIGSFELNTNLDRVYPKGKYRIPEEQSSAEREAGICAVMEIYSSIDSPTRSKLDDALFAYYVGKHLVGQHFSTLATVAFIAALKPFRSRRECSGILTCSACGKLAMKHDVAGEVAELVSNLARLFGMKSGSEEASELRKSIRDVYRHQRSSYVHDAILRHGEFQSVGPSMAAPSPSSPISDYLRAHNELQTLELITRRALLQYIICRLGKMEFDPKTYGIEAAKFTSRTTMFGLFTAPSKVLVAIRA